MNSDVVGHLGVRQGDNGVRRDEELHDTLIERNIGEHDRLLFRIPSPRSGATTTLISAALAGTYAAETTVI
jgi:hypothetical protein